MRKVHSNRGGGSSLPLDTREQVHLLFSSLLFFLLPQVPILSPHSLLFFNLSIAFFSAFPSQQLTEFLNDTV